MLLLILVFNSTNCSTSPLEVTKFRRASERVPLFITAVNSSWSTHETLSTIDRDLQTLADLCSETAKFENREFSLLIACQPFRSYKPIPNNSSIVYKTWREVCLFRMITMFLAKRFSGTGFVSLLPLDQAHITVQSISNFNVAPLITKFNQISATLPSHWKISSGVHY